MRKKLIGAFSAAAMMVMLPTVALGADNVTVETPTAGDTTLTVSYTDATSSDSYNVQVNGKTVIKGSLSQTGDRTIKFNLGTTLAEGDSVLVLITDEDGDYVPVKTTVKAAPVEKQPTTMTASATSVKAEDGAQITVNFDSAYVPNANDMLQVTRYDASNAVLSSYFVTLPDTNSGSVPVLLNDSQNTAYYVIRFIPGDGSTTNLSAVRVNVGDYQPNNGDNDSNNDNNDSGNDDNNNNGSNDNNNNNNSNNNNGSMTDAQKAQVEAATAMSFTYPSDSVALGESVTPTITLTDANGQSAAYTGPLSFSYSGAAVVDGSFESTGQFSVSSDPSYVGSKIQVTAMLGKFSQTVELTVQANDKSLILTPTSAAAGTSHSMSYQIADGNGNRLRMLWTPTVARVVATPIDDTSATIIGTVTDMSNVNVGGNGTLLLSSTKPTKAEVYIIFRDSEGRLFETGRTTVTFTEGTNNSGEGTSVKLYIGKTNYTINDEEKTADSAPLIQNSRTFVPFRLLAETFGADVKWDGDTQTITTTLGDTSVVMKIGSTTYTINGTEGTMDVAPYINSANRTMVPLRFLAEALGCKVTPNYAANGTTESVVFEK